jgi:hypothetical protein
MDHDGKNKKNKKKDDGKNGVIGVLAGGEVSQRYGGAIKEHFVVYDGVDNEASKTLTKGLKSISESKVHPDYEAQNLK